MLRFFVLSIALAWKGNHFVLHMGNNSNKKKSQKRIILESNWECANGLLI